MEVIWKLFLVKSKSNECFGNSINSKVNWLDVNFILEGLLCEIQNTCFTLFLIKSIFNIVLRATVSGTPVTHDIAFKTHDLPKIPIEDLWIATCWNMIHIVIATHGDTNICINSSFKRWIVYFKLSSFVNISTLLVSMCFLVVVDEMFHYANYSIILYTFDHLRR